MKYVINYLVSIKVQLIFEHFNIEGLDKYMSFNLKLKLVLQHAVVPDPHSQWLETQFIISEEYVEEIVEEWSDEQCIPLLA